MITQENIYEPKNQPEKSRIDELKEAFLNIKEKIEAELERSPKNNWLNCFGSRACEIANLLYLAHKELEQDQKDSANPKIEWLSKRLSELNREYQGKNAVIPDEIKQELLDFLTLKNILGEEFF